MLRAAAPWPALRWAGPVAGGLAAVVLGWGLGVPALWLDESATVVATQRDWGAFWHLHEGSEAPLVPFYALVKVVVAAVGAVGAVLPGGALPLEVLYRLPSVVAAVLAVGVLAAWLARHATRGVVVASVGVLLLVPSFSRYGQAARPYAVALAVAVLATVAWSRLVGYGAGPAGGPPPS